jgi:hypothetical protein
MSVCEKSREQQNIDAVADHYHIGFVAGQQAPIQIASRRALAFSNTLIFVRTGRELLPLDGRPANWTGPQWLRRHRAAQRLRLT